MAANSVQTSRGQCEPQMLTGDWRATIVARADIQRGEAMVVRPRSPFGALLRRYRLAANLSRESPSALERGPRRNPYPETVRLLANAFELDDARHDAPPQPLGVPQLRNDALLK